MRRVFYLAAMMAALTVGARGASAALETPRALAAITGLRVVPAAGGADVVIAVDGAVEVIDFTLANPRRIVLDFRGATLALPARFYDKVSRGGITDVRIAQYRADIVRLVLDLDGPHEYSVVRGDREVRVAVSGPDQFAAWYLGNAARAAAAAPPPSAQSAPAAPVAIMPPAQPAAAKPAAIKPVEQPAAANPTALAVVQQPRITVTYEKDTEVRDVVASFAAFANKTIVAGAGVASTKVGYMEIKDKPWDVALAAVLQSVGLTAIEDASGIITVDSHKNISERQAQELLVSQIVPINYAKASTLAKTIADLLNAGCSKTGGANAPSPQAPVAASAVPPSGDAAAGSTIATSGCGRGSVATDEKTNALIITETQTRLNDVMGFIKDLDVRTPLVAIKAKIIAVDRTGTEQLGLSYDLGSTKAFQNKLMPRYGSGGAAVPGDFRVDLSGTAFSGIANADRSYKSNGAISLIYNMALGNYNLTSFLDALSQQQLSDIQAEPSTTTLDNTEATLFAGQTISFLLTPPVPAGQVNTVAPQIQTKEIGITLRVTPRVTANRQLNLSVDAIQEQFLGSTAAGPETAKRSAHNEVLVADGETAVIGGLTQTQVSKSRSGIPVLSSLPVLGRLFSQTDTVERKSDLLILITPQIIDDGDVVKGRPAEAKKR